MNKYYEKFLNNRSSRTPVFEWAIRNALDREEFPTILEIGAMRPDDKDPDMSFFSDGYSTFYWAEYLRKRRYGKLKIVDIDPIAIERLKVLFEDFKDVNIELVVGNGLNYLGGGETLVYLDGPDDCGQTYRMFRKIDRSKSNVLLDDANFSDSDPGKCLWLRKVYGGYTIFPLRNTLHEMMFYPRFKDGKFTIGKISLDYCSSFFNYSYENERRVEVPLGQWFVDKFNRNVVEVGCVLPYYGKDSHTIYDLTDPHPKSIKMNALELDYSGKNILSISTIEHLNKREYNNGSDEDAIKLLQAIVKNAQNYLVTFPVTYHNKLDEFVKRSQIPHTFLVRTNWENDWVQSNDKDCWNLLFGGFDGRNPDGYYNNANSICIVTNLPELAYE